jgi:hypothetical protein
MIVIVSGYRRCGTSAMMQALCAGGLPVIYQPGMEKRNPPADEDGYKPIPGRLLEVGQVYYMSMRFLRILPAQKGNSLVKIFYDGLPALPRGDYTVVFMRRDPDEIKASTDRVDRRLRAVGTEENPRHWYPFDVFRPYKQEDIDHVLGIMRARVDIDLVEVNFRDMIERPAETFHRIKYRESGSKRFDLDIGKAVSIINPDLWRERNEHSEGGGAGSRAEGDRGESAGKEEGQADPGQRERRRVGRV